MRKWIWIANVLLLLPNHGVFAQPKEIPPPPEFQKLIGPAKFDPAMLREAIAFPVSATQFDLKIASEKDEEIPPVTVIEKKLVGDDRDAEWLLKLGDALDKIKSDRAKGAYERSVAAFRKRIEREPKVAKHYVDLCDPLYRLYRPAEAFACAKKSVELDPRNADCWWVLNDCYWRELTRLICEDGANLSWQSATGQPPPDVVKPLTDAQKEKAHTLLRHIEHCQQQWQRHSPAGPQNLIVCDTYRYFWDLFDNYIRTGEWDAAINERFKLNMLKKLPEKLVEYGRENQDAVAFGVAAGCQFASFAKESQDPQWSPGKMTAAQKGEFAATLQALEKLADHKDTTIAIKASVTLAALALVTDDQPGLERFAAKALGLAPREKAALDMMAVAQKNRPGADKFWEDHARKYPSARVWLLRSFTHFRNKKYDDSERCVREGEKFDPKDRSIQLAKAALALRKGDATLSEAGRILDELQKRLDEPAEKDALFGASEHPSFPDSYHYLRAIHTALSGKWKQARDQLLKLQEKAALGKAIEKGEIEEAITNALEAFPRRGTAPPAELDSPPRPTLLPPLTAPLPNRNVERRFSP